MRKRILAFIICLVIVSLSLNVFSANDINDITNEEDTNNITENKTLEEQKAEITSKLEESNTKLEYVQSELGTTLSKVEELDDSVNNYQTQYEELMNQINEIEVKLQDTNKQIEEIEQVYAKKQRILKKRVVAMYEAGDSTYMDVLLSSSSIVDFISNYFTICELIECDTNLLEELENTKSKIEKVKTEQEQKEVELRTAKQQINQTKILLENTKIIKENYMLQLTDEEKALQEEITKYKEEQKELEDKIALAINWTGTMSIQFTGGAMIWPIAMEGTYITSPYGNRLHPIQGVYKNHAGIDIAGPNVNRAPVVAAADGIVAYAGWISGYGNCVMINHGSGIISLYGHGSEIVTETGKEVKQGEIIMRVGSTGNSTGPHVHFEIRKNGVVVDPIPYLNGEVTEINEEVTSTNEENQNSINSDSI
jgi:murein DD-endopeptidase MepM/ murein hydrolase activator NlpD